MTDKEALETWVQRAIVGGWDFRKTYTPINYYFNQSEVSKDNKLMLHFQHRNHGHLNKIISLSIPDLIASHDFMSAVYGDEKRCYSKFACLAFVSTNKIPKKLCGSCCCNLPAHQYHAQQLINLSPAERIEHIKRGLAE